MLRRSCNIAEYQITVTHIAIMGKLFFTVFLQISAIPMVQMNKVQLFPHHTAQNVVLYIQSPHRDVLQLDQI